VVASIEEEDDEEEEEEEEEEKEEEESTEIDDRLVTVFAGGVQGDEINFTSIS
jgi:hypothetical protein